MAKSENQDQCKSSQTLARDLQKVLRCLEYGTHVNKPPVLTITQMRILSFFQEKDIIHVSDISRKADMSIQSVNNLISRLEAGGYVQRSPNARDRRLSDISLTDTGRASIDMYQRCHVQQVQDLLRGLSPDDQQRLAEAFNDVVRILEKAEKKVFKT